MTAGKGWPHLCYYGPNGMIEANRMRPLAALAYLFCLMSMAGRAFAQVMIDTPSPSQNHVVHDQFEFSDYENLVAGLPQKEQYRLCGLDKMCMTLWKQEKLKVSGKGKRICGDFNGDGKEEDAIVLEKDDSTGTQYFVCISEKEKKKTSFHQEIPVSRIILDMAWDEKNKAIAVDTGQRIMKGASTVTFEGRSLAGRSGQLEKVVAWIVWNQKTDAFELSMRNVEVKGKDRE